MGVSIYLPDIVFVRANCRVRINKINIELRKDFSKFRMKFYVFDFEIAVSYIDNNS